MKLFIIPSWYPTKLHPESGTFFRDRAIILSKSDIEVVVIAHVLHSFKDVFHFNKIKVNQFQLDDNLPVYINESINKYPRFPRYTFYQYKKNTLKLFNKAIKENGAPDLVFFNSSIWSSVALFEDLKERNIPYIISEHLKEFMIPGSFTPFQKKIIANAYHSCSQIIATSSALAKSISNNFPSCKEKLSIIPNPVDENIFSLKSITNKKSFITITCIALFRKEKRIDLVIESFNNILKSGIKCKLKLIGDGPLKSYIHKKIKLNKMSDNIQLLGYLSQDQIVKELHKSDLVVLASDIETFGVVLIEAQVCGVPVLATDCGGPRDIISSKTGVLTRPGSIDDFTRGMKNIINKLDRYDAVSIRNRTIKYFGRNAYIEAIRNVIKKSLN